MNAYQQGQAAMDACEAFALGFMSESQRRDFQAAKSAIAMIERVPDAQVPELTDAQSDIYSHVGDIKTAIAVIVARGRSD